jgi:hypothetical protein
LGHAPRALSRPANVAITSCASCFCCSFGTPTLRARLPSAAFEQAVGRLYPSIATNPDYTWIINDHHFARLTGLVTDAVAKGARMIEVGAKASGPSASQSRLFLPKLLGVNDSMEVMKFLARSCRSCPIASSTTPSRI